MNKKIRFTVGCCGECPAYSYSEMFGAGYCDKMRKPVDDAGKIREGCPYLEQRVSHKISGYRTYRSRVGKLIVSNLRRPYPYDKERRDRCMKILKEKGYTQSRLAKELGTSQQNISMVLSGRSLSKMFETKIAQHFSMERDDFFIRRTGIELLAMYPDEEVDDRYIKIIREKISEEEREFFRKNGRP